jgi:C4-dicarboxylate-specific signal transduction histidine kinase
LIAKFGREITNADRCSIWIIDKSKNELWTIVAQDVESNELRIPIDKGVVGYSIKLQEPVIVNDAYNSDLFFPDMDKITGYKTNCLMSIPVNDTNGNPIGAIQVINKKDGTQEFVDNDLEHLQIAASYIGDSLETLFLQQELKALNDKLALEVEQKTEDLQNINRLLEQRIAEEIDKNHQKDLQLMSQAKQAQMGEMISVIAHQWKQPLATMSAICNTASLEIALEQHSPEKAKKHFDFIMDQIKFLTDTIDEFRHFFNPDKKKDIFCVNNMVDKVVHLIDKDFATRNIEIKRNLYSAIDITNFQNEIMHVVLNICNNSKDAILENSVEEGVINISSHDKEDVVLVVISDNGGGIPENVIGKIFEPYFSTKGEKKGTGIGLNLSRMIIEDKCGGKLTASNIENGAVFTIELPKEQC